MANCQGTILGAPCVGPATDCPIHAARIVQLCRDCATDLPSGAVMGNPVDMRCNRCMIDSVMVTIRNYFLPALQ